MGFDKPAMGFDFCRLSLAAYALANCSAVSPISSIELMPQLVTCFKTSSAEPGSERKL
jgi:hypothetical protein